MLYRGKRETRGQGTWALVLTVLTLVGGILELSLSLCWLQFQWLLIRANIHDLRVNPVGEAPSFPLGDGREAPVAASLLSASLWPSQPPAPYPLPSHPPLFPALGALIDLDLLCSEPKDRHGNRLPGAKFCVYIGRTF